MIDVKQCDRCKRIMKEDFGMRIMTVIRVKKIKPFFFDLCDIYILEFNKFINKEVGE